MIGTLWMVALALASPEASTVQQLHELEWDRADLAFVDPQLAGASDDVRAEGVRTLGRLRTEQALSRLDDLRTDPAEQVRRAVAEALALTPGSAELVRTWLAEVDLPRGLAERAREQHGVSVLLVEALGYQGSARDIQSLVTLLDEPWPVGAAAARALGRLGVRQEPGAEQGVGALAARLAARDPRLVDACAWALSRIGMEGANDRSIEHARARLDGRTTPEARAWLIKAVWSRLDGDEREELVLAATSDPSRLPRVAVLTALQPEDLPADVLSIWLVDPDPWIRIATIRALGRMTSGAAGEALERHVREAEPYEAAAAIAALGRPDSDALADPETPAPMRAALAGQVDNPDALLLLAQEDPEPAVRSAAAAALVSDERTEGAVAFDLLGASDAAVREVALELVDRLPERARVPMLLQHLRSETDDAVIHGGLQRLLELHESNPRLVPADDDYLAVALRRGAGSRSSRTRSLARDLSRALDLPVPDVPDPGERGRELILPSGDVVRVEGGWPAVEEVRRIRGAIVQTSLGTFHLQLDPDTAPLAVSTFANLAQSGFYDGVVFHRVEPGFVVQTGCPRGDGWGGPGFTVPDERSLVTYDAGSLGMARATEPDTAGSQWFVTTSDQPHLDGRYTRFGEVTRGMHVVRRLSEGAIVEEIRIERVRP